MKCQMITRKLMLVDVFVGIHGGAVISFWVSFVGSVDLAFLVFVHSLSLPFSRYYLLLSIVDGRTFS